MLVLQSLHGLSLEATEHMVRDRLSWLHFCGLKPHDTVPDANTLWDFREALIKAGVLDELFKEMNQVIAEAGFISRSGQVVEHFFRRPSAGVECGRVASRDGLELPVGAEPPPQPSAASEDEREQMDFPDDAGLVGVFGFELGEVDLGLLAGFGLEAPLEPGRRVRPDRAEIIRHRRIAAFVAALPDLPEQPASGQIPIFLAR